MTLNTLFFFCSKIEQKVKGLDLVSRFYHYYIA